MDHFDAVVVGAGVVGLAVARVLALGGFAPLILESEATIGSGTSSRNSEVIHAGIYYAPGSLKARACVAGRDRLYAYCAERGVSHRRCGKLIVAVDAAEAVALDAIEMRARACGVHDLQRLTGAAVRQLEPALDCHAALLSPSTGIVDSHALMTALLGDAENAGALLALRTRFAGAERHPGGWRVRTADGFELDAGCIVNAAGLDAHAVASAIDGCPPLPPRVLAKGSYFTLTRRSPFSRLIYPVPVDGGLGVHLTLDLAGQARFGPDVEWIAGDIDYAVDPARGAAFEAGIRRWWPGLPDDALAPAYSGVRPKLSGPGAPAADFQLLQAPGAVHLLGIESPGLTASLALAEAVHRIVRDMTQRTTTR